MIIKKFQAKTEREAIETAKKEEKYVENKKIIFFKKGVDNLF